MNWIIALLTAHLISATTVYNVLPDNISPVHCPSQPCATLSQYLKDNSTISFVSDVEYHFLPGEYLVTTNIIIHHVKNFILSGNKRTSPSLLECHSGVFISVEFSNNVTITGVSIRNCGNNESYLFASTIIRNCANCNIVDVIFNPPAEQYSIKGINLVGESFLHNISVYLIPSSSRVCGKGIAFRHCNVNNSWMKNSKTIISKFNFNVKHSGCSSYGAGSNGVYLNFFLEDLQYTTTFEIHESSINGLVLDDNPIIYSHMENCNVTIFWFKNCTFNNMQTSSTPTSMIEMNIPHANVIVEFVQCAFYSNHLEPAPLLEIAVIICKSCRRSRICNIIRFSSYLTIDNCIFSHNQAPILMLQGMYAHNVVVKVLLIGSILISRTVITVLAAGDYNYRSLIHLKKVDVYMNSTINVSYNKASSLLLFESCDVVSISGTFCFIANICSDQTIGLIAGTKYIIIKEYTIIKFIDNHSYHLISVGDYRYNNVHFNQPNPYCLFQYMRANNTVNSPPPTDHYTIIIKATGGFYGDVSWSSSSIWYNTVHCKWVPTAAYYGYHPGPVNKKIVNITDLIMN